MSDTGRSAARQRAARRPSSNPCATARRRGRAASPPRPPRAARARRPTSVGSSAHRASRTRAAPPRAGRPRRERALHSLPACVHSRRVGRPCGQSARAARAPATPSRPASRAATVASETPSSGGRLGDVQPAEEAALDHRRLTRSMPRELLECRVEREQVVGRRGRGRALRRTYTTRAAAALVGVAPPRRLDEHLAHGAGGDALEVQAATPSRGAATSASLSHASLTSAVGLSVALGSSRARSRRGGAAPRTSR